MTLYISHVLVGQARWKDAPSFLKADTILPEERKFLIKELLDQAWQEHEDSLHRKQPVPAHSASALAAAQGSSKGKSSSQSSTPEEHGALMSRESSSVGEEKGFMFKYLQYFKDNLCQTSPLAAVSGVLAVAAILFWFSQRKKMKVNPSTGIFSGGWGTYWLYRIFQICSSCFTSNFRRTRFSLIITLVHTMFSIKSEELFLIDSLHKL
ncbi:hypothetical protein DSO57_1034381 [Entomophthora muscae]|uniref:Uncharacterized protein n=1 Tax=Entomophthora muscae TaxID=34485 RepID=A0ACC2S290_9FUNG|nr:hypothetical protein DSO57_1034381 [Entomophthora muscae]